MRYPHLAARIFDVPLLVDERKLKVIVGVLEPRIFGGEGAEAAIYDPGRAEEIGPRELWRPYLIENGAGVIKVTGTLVNRMSLPDAMSGATSYQATAQALRAAIADPEVERVILDIDSPGGEAAGAFALADEVYAMRGVKPITAVVNDVALSGGYLIASAADEVLVSSTGEVGSIGVVYTHRDVSKMNEKLGITVTHVYAGERKVDGSPYFPLSEPAFAAIKDDVKKIHALFVSSVARGRNISPDAVVETQAAVYRGQDGIDVGLADRFGSLHTEIFHASSVVGPRTLTLVSTGFQETRDMAEQKTTPASARDVIATLEQTTIDVEAAKREAASFAASASAAAMQARIKAIIGNDEAKGREELAQHLAFDMDVSAEAAVACLAKAPKPTATAPGASTASNRFETAMSRSGNPNVGPDASGTLTEADEVALEAAKVVAYGPRRK